MKAWQKQFDEDVLNQARSIACDVRIISSDGVEFIGEVESFKVKTYIEYNSPSHTSCNCSEMGYCRHEAALIYFLIDHPELYSFDLDLKTIMDNVSEDNIKKFLLSEFKSDSELKNRFITQFQNNSIDKKYYRNKLSRIFKSGECREFKYHGIYDLDLMENNLYDFIFTDISKILSAGEYEFACELLSEIADLLNDEIMSTYDSWYNLVDGLMEQVSVLSMSIHLDSEKMDVVYSNMDVIWDLL